MIRFVVLTTQRSGSTFFCESLSRSPLIHCMRECTRTDRDLSRAKDYSLSHFLNVHRIDDFTSLSPKERSFYLEAFLDLVTADNLGVEAVGFKLMYSLFEDKPEHLAWMRRRGVYVIHLMRRNKLKRLVSWVIMQKIWKRGNVTRKMPQAKIHLKVDGLEALLQDMEDQVAHYRDQFVDTLPYLEVAYEDFITRRKNETRRVGEFLGLGALGHLASNLVKFNSDDLRDIVINYDEVSAALANTSFSHFLEPVTGR